MKKVTDRSSFPIYQLKITLRDSKPPIWRRIIIPSYATLLDLHYVTQAAMGWANSHLHQFIIGKIFYSLPDEEGDLIRQIPDRDEAIEIKSWQLSNSAPPMPSRRQ